MKPVRWIDPEIERGSVHWPACAAKVTTEEAVQTRNRLRGGNLACDNRAKVDYRGTLLCLKHAHARALDEVIAESNAPSQLRSGERNE